MNKYFFHALIALATMACWCPFALGVETVPHVVTEEMLFADDPKVWLTISRVSPPAYPKEQFGAGVTGYVDIDVTIDELGAVKKIGEVTSKPVNPAFERAARESVKYWKFQSKLSAKCTPEIGQGNIRVWFEIRDGKEVISVSSRSGSMGTVAPAGESNWRPMLNRQEVARATYYPASARKDDQQGVIFAVMLVDSATGLARDVEIAHAITSRQWVRNAFELVVRQAIKVARFEPRPQEQGQTFKVCMPFNFFLTK